MTSIASLPQDLDQHVRQVQRRTVRYWFDDGLAELVIGGFFVLIGLYLAALGTIPLQGYTAMLFGILFPLLVIGGILGARRLIGRAKEGLVYPRTGYVSYARPSQRQRWLTPILAAIISALLVALVRRAPSLESWIPAFEGLLVGGFLVLMNRSARLGRLSFLAGVSSLTGLLLALRGGPSETTGGIFFTIVGIVMLAGGALALRRYLRQAPPPAEKA